MSDAKQRKITPPPINQETQHFWDATAQGKLLIKKCLDAISWSIAPADRNPIGCQVIFCKQGVLLEEIGNGY